MKLPCAVVRDLLPLYAERMTEPETQKLIDAHLEDCAECRQKLAEIDTDIISPVESTRSLMALKKEILKRRWFAAIFAALLVFVIVYTYFYHVGKMVLIPWQDGLIEVEGIETRLYEEVYGYTESSDLSKSTVDVLVIKVDGIINGTSEDTIKDEDGSTTVILQGWRSNHSGNNLTADFNEMLLCPVPDRLLYDAGGQQHLLWGELMNGGVEVLPRLALGFYAITAAGCALILGAVWFFLRKRDICWIFRQLFFAPVSYVIAHCLIKGVSAKSFFIESDFFHIMLIAVALYALLSLAWQIWSRHRRTVL